MWGFINHTLLFKFFNGENYVFFCLQVDVRDQSELDEQNGLAELLKEGLEEGWKKTSQIENHPPKYPPSAEEMLRRLRQLMQGENLREFSLIILMLGKYVCSK